MRYGGTAKRHQPVEVSRVDPLLMAVALNMAEHDPARLLILSADSVIILNYPHQRFPKRSKL